MRIHRMATAAMVALLATACTDQTPFEIDDQSIAEQAQYSRTDGVASARPVVSSLLSDLPVVGDLADGSGTFEGLLSITDLAFENGQLLASGTLTGTATQVVDGATIVTEIAQTFTDMAVDLVGSGPGNACRILELDIPGGLTLDLLGLVVDLAPLNLEVRGERGPGNLLGNLLCAITGLLDGGALGGITSLLDQINNLL